MSIWSQIMLQDANSPIMENMIMFYDHAMMVIMIIMMMIIYIISFMFKNNLVNRNILEGQMIEIIWTIFPMMFLIFLAIPSLKILYLSDEVVNPMFSLKVIGHQWYWSYEYSDFKELMFDSFMLSLKDLDKNMFRLLEVDNRIILPYNNYIRLMVSSLDVIHSFTLPSLGIKVDAIPGRINQIMLLVNRPGLYYGQCSEICGVNHSFMPIVLESVNLNNFLNWIKLN